MNLKFYLEKLKSSEEYKKFMKENPDAFLCSGFFVIDKSGDDSKQHFDFYVSSPPNSATNSCSQVREIDKKVINKETKSSSDINSSTNNTNEVSAIKRGKLKGKMFSFQLENGVKLVPVELFDDRVPEKIVIDFDFDFEEVERAIEGKMQGEGINKKIQKILLSLQRIDGRNFLVGAVFISGLGMIKVNIDISEMKIVLFEKKSFLDMVRRIK